MPSDKKLHGKRRSKRQFRGNQFTNGNNDEKNTGENSSSNVNVCNEENYFTTSSHINSIKESATPTRTELKLHNMFALQCETSDDSSNSDSDSGNIYNCVTVTEELHGNRIIDVDILNNSMSQVVCKHCHGEVKLHEVERKGLGSKFTFMCNNRHCEREVFSSCPMIPVGNYSVYSINR
jgi:hypothetical protein